MFVRAVGAGARKLIVAGSVMALGGLHVAGSAAANTLPAPSMPMVDQAPAATEKAPLAVPVAADAKPSELAQPAVPAAPNPPVPAVESVPTPAARAEASKPAAPAAIVAAPPAAPAALAVPNGVEPDAHAVEALAKEQKAGTVLHPLQAAAPDYNVIVCEAGCGTGARTQIVYKEAKFLRRPLTNDPKKDGNDPITLSAECKAGCAPAPSSGLANAALGTAAKTMDETAGRWLTTVSPAPAGAGKAGAKKAPSNAALREDWMARIKRDRDDEKPVAVELPLKRAEPNPNPVPETVSEPDQATEGGRS